MPEGYTPQSVSKVLVAEPNEATAFLGLVNLLLGPQHFQPESDQFFVHLEAVVEVPQLRDTSPKSV